MTAVLQLYHDGRFIMLQILEIFLKYVWQLAYLFFDWDIIPTRVYSLRIPKIQNRVHKGLSTNAS